MTDKCTQCGKDLLSDNERCSDPECRCADLEGKLYLSNYSLNIVRKHFDELIKRLSMNNVCPHMLDLAGIDDCKACDADECLTCWQGIITQMH